MASTTTASSFVPLIISTVAPTTIDYGYSGGSIFCLLFFCGCLIYFGGGMAIRKFLRGAEGHELIPHYEFWVEFPQLMRDGIVFTINGCQPELTYERI